MLLRDIFDESPVPADAPVGLLDRFDQPLDALADWRRAETLLRDARAALPGRLEPAVALYKMYAYSNRQDQALALALIDEVLTEAAAQAGFPADWRGLAPASTAWAQASGPVRIYLYSLKARGFVLLRQAQPEAAREVLLKLM